MQQGRWDLQVLNLGSRYEGWYRSVWEILEEILNPETRRLPSASISEPDYLRRVTSLKYIGLVDELAIEESRRAFPERSREEEPDRDLHALLADVRDAPLMDERDRELLGPEEAQRWEEELSRPSIREPDLEVAGGIAGEEPHHGTGEETTAIVDCYGLYVESLLGWMQALGSGANRRVLELMHDMQRYDEEDGPAILLSPELISTLHRLVMSRAHRAVRYYLDPELSPDRLFLKLVMAHELGHHVYPGHPSATKNVSEAMANWFAYSLTDPDERAVLFEKTQTQREPYQMYEGVLSLLYPSAPGTALTAALPWNFSTGGDLVSSIERAAFEGFLGDRRGLPPSPIADDLKRAAEVWSRLASSPASQDLLRSMPDEGLHPARVMGWTFLSEAFPGPGGELARAMQHLQYTAIGPWHPMSRLRQFLWRRSVWPLYRSMY